MRIAFLNPQGNFDRRDSFLTEHLDFGGQLVYVKELSLALARMGVNVDIVTRWIDDPEWPGLDAAVDSYAEGDDRLRVVRIPFGGPRFLEKERLWPHLGEFVENALGFFGQERPDYLTAHYADGGYSAVLMQQRTKLGFTFTGHSLGAQKIDKLGVNQANIDEYERRFRFSRRIEAERLAMARADTIITSTNQERYEQYAHPLYAGTVNTSDDEQFSVIPPGVNTRIFTEVQRDDDREVFARLAEKIGSHDKPYVLVSSRLDKRKNIIGVVDAYARSPVLQGSARLALFVRGVDDPYSETASLPHAERTVLEPILERIHVAGIADRVDFFNILSQRYLAASYRFFARRGSVFALSSFHEPVGLAPIEAAACGLAVVATKSGGPSEIFEDGSAVLVDPTDAEDIGRGLASALQGFHRLSSAGKQRVLTRHTWEQTARGYLRTIEQNLTRRRIVDKGHDPLDAGPRIASYLQERVCC